MAEGYGPWPMGNDEQLLSIIATANIACGFHAGDYQIMGGVIKKAQEQGVSVGAHPGFYDLHGFGRRQFTLSFDEVERLIAYQLGAAMGIAANEGGVISHVKPHGALNNMACQDDHLAAAIIRAIAAIDRSLIVLAPVLSALERQGRRAGLAVAGEVFADRAYLPDGQLVPRSSAGAMIDDPDDSLLHCLQMFEDGIIKTNDGSKLKIEAQSVCVHGDQPEAIKIARHVRKGLEAAGFELRTLPEMLA